MEVSPDMEDADSECMRHLKEGDDLALNEIMQRWQQKIVNYLMRCLGNETDALELAQETFVRVYENRSRYEARAAFSCWLYRIATNLARSRMRWRARHPAVSMEAASRGERTDATAMELPSEELTASEVLILKERASAVRAAVQRLDIDFRTVLLLFEFEDRSYQQIANILGCTAKAVENKLHRARQALRNELQTSSSQLL